MPVIKSAAGSVMMMAILMTMIVSGAIFIFMQYLIMSYEVEQTEFFKRKFEVINSSLISSINNENIWNRIMSHASNAGAGFACLTSATVPCSPNPQKFTFVDSFNYKISDPSDPSLGVDINGNPCHEFNENRQLASARCPIRYEFSWSPDCVGCKFKLLSPRIVGKIKFSHPGKIVLNTALFEIDYVREKGKGSVSETCASLKGRYQTSTGHCIIPSTDIVPPTSKVFTGLELNTDEPSFQDSPAVGLISCPPSLVRASVPVGVDGSGSVLCDLR